MEKTALNHERTRKLVLTATFTAIVFVLQFVSANVRFGPFSITLALAPIVIGGAMCGVAAGAWLGLMFGLAVLITGDAAAFLAVNVFGTVVVVLLKGAAAGAASAYVFRLVEQRGVKLASIAAAVTAPVVNTGVFLLGCLVFFMPTVSAWGASMGYESVGAYMILGLVGLNFIVEFITVTILSGAITMIIKQGKRV